jgi:hypothetical protein
LSNFVVMARKSKKEMLLGIGVGTQPLITVDPSLPSFEGHPFFEKKAARAKALLKKTGLPKQLAKKTNS